MKKYRPIRCARLDVKLTTAASRKGNRVVASGLMVGFKRHQYKDGSCVRCHKEKTA